MPVTHLPDPLTVLKDRVTYPESDGLPMANNTEQFRLITTIEGNLEILFANEPQVFVAGDLLWYPIEGNNATRMAPDVLVVFGRPKGDRGAYLQWREGGIAPQVVFEILSPGNRKQEMADKFAFYARHGVEEYYLYDPNRGRLQGWLRNAANELAPLTTMNNWRSPRLGIRFVLEGLELQLYYPDDSRFLTFLELSQRLDLMEKRAFEALWQIDEAEVRAAEAEQAHQAETAARAAAEVRATEAEQAHQAETAARAAAEVRATEAEQARVVAEARIKELEEQLHTAGLR